jgi:serine/threonine protein kinase
MIPRLPAGFSHPMRIGEGAFASVYRVRHKALDRWVALKFVYEKNPDKRRGLLKEARTQAKLRADSIPQIYDAFEWHGSVCMVMEWISGVPLSILLDRELTEQERLSIAGGFIRALCAIHGLGFVHRDLKPENIMITPDRGLFLVDFGFSKNIADMQMSTVAHAKGTPAFMAPELWLKGDRADLMRSDVYSCGKILRLLLSATPAAEFTDALLFDEPLRRPASGAVVRQMWEASPWADKGNADWREIAGALTAELLSSELLAAAKQLLHGKRDEEAYWLLAESIEQDGNNREALEIMGNFRTRTHNRFSAVHYAVLSVIILCGLIAAFFAGKRSMEAASHEPTPVKWRHSPMLVSFRGESPATGRGRLREDPPRTDRLYGRIVFRDLPRVPVIRVDGRVVDPDSASGAGLKLHWGDHDVSICDTGGRTYRRESITVLPFQTKTVAPVMPDHDMKGVAP